MGVVFGFIKNSTKKNIPMMVKYLSSLYSSFDYDEFEIAHKSIQIDGKCATRIGRNGYKSAFLANKVDFGIHRWRFQIIKHGFIDSIGIWNAKRKPDKLHLGLSSQREYTYSAIFGNNSYNF